MRRVTIYRLSFRLTGKDIDLLWLDADGRTPSLSVLVKQVLRGVLLGEQTMIPLPEIPQKPLKTKTIGVRFYKGEEDITKWLQNIEKGSRGLVVKELLRHAMEMVDYRPYIIKNADIPLAVSAPKKKYQPSQPVVKDSVWSPVYEAVPEKIDFSPEPEDDAEEDDWIAAFEKMSQQ